MRISVGPATMAGPSGVSFAISCVGLSPGVPAGGTVCASASAAIRIAAPASAPAARSRRPLPDSMKAVEDASSLPSRSRRSLTVARRGSSGPEIRPTGRSPTPQGGGIACAGGGTSHATATLTRCSSAAFYGGNDCAQAIHVRDDSGRLRPRTRLGSSERRDIHRHSDAQAGHRRCGVGPTHRDRREVCCRRRSHRPARRAQEGR